MRPKQPLASGALLAVAVVFGSVAAFAQTESLQVVRLPAFVVEKPGATKWFHAKVAGIEVLSHLSNHETAQYVEAIAEQGRSLGWRLPPGENEAPPIPLIAILDPRDSTPFHLYTKAAAERGPQVPGKGSSNRKHGEADDQGVLLGGAFTYDDYPTAFLSERTPTPTAGLATYFVSMAAVSELAHKPGWEELASLVGSGYTNLSTARDGLDLRLTLTERGEEKLPLPSVTTAFAYHPVLAQNSPSASRTEAGIWFVRWALLAEHGHYHDSFWAFAQAVSVMPYIDEGLARHFFDLSIAQLDHNVAEFRTNTLKHPTAHFLVALPVVETNFDLREATPEEVMRGQVEWMLSTWRKYPALAAPLRSAAEQSIAHVRSLTSNTKSAIVLQAWIEIQDNHDHEAQALFESITPMAALDLPSRIALATLRYSAALAEPTTKVGPRFPTAQAEYILAPLQPEGLAPTIGEKGLALALLTWRNAESRPARERLKQLASSVLLYPRNGPLVGEAARLCYDEGLNDEASALVQLGSVAATSDPVREALQALAVKYNTPKK